MQPFFSIVIPSYNRADLIAKAIQSVLDQTFQDFEIIVVDDCSKDNTAEVVAAFHHPGIRYYRNEVNLERSATRNRGILEATGKYITFLDSDDYYFPGHLKKSYDHLAKHHSDIYYQRYAIVDDRGIQTGQGRWIKQEVFKQLLKEGTVLHLNGIFVKKEISRTVLFREDMNQSEDYEYFIRLLMNHPIEYTNELTSALLSHQGRGVLNINKASLILNMELLLKYVTENEIFIKSYKPYLRYIRSGASSYISLHLVLANDLKGGIRFLLRSLVENPVALFRRRTLAIVKHILLRMIARKS